MSRPLRLEFPNVLHHVTSREDRRENIYEDDDDRIRFLAILGTVVVDYNWLCHGYCLMNNHYHLIIETLDGNLSKGMRQLWRLYPDAESPLWTQDSGVLPLLCYIEERGQIYLCYATKWDNLVSLSVIKEV